MKIYEPHSNGYNDRQREFADQQQRKLDRRYPNRKRKGSKLRTIFIILALGAFVVLCGSPLIISGQLLSGDRVVSNTQPAIVAINTPRPTATLQNATWEPDRTPQAQDDDLGFVVVPDGFWQTPGVVEAYRAGTPIAVLVNQPVQIQANNPIMQATPDPRIEQAKNDLAIAQINAQIEAANLGPKMTATVMAADAVQTIEKKQAISDRIANLGQMAVSIIFWLFMIGAGVVVFRFVLIPLADLFTGGLVDLFGNTIDRLRFWVAELRQPVIQEVEEAEQPEPVYTHHGSDHLRRVMREQAQADREEQQLVDVILNTWDETNNLTECQRRAFGKDENGNWRTGGTFYNQAKAIVDRYRPGNDQSPTTSSITPYFGNTTQ